MISVYEKIRNNVIGALRGVVTPSEQQIKKILQLQIQGQKIAEANEKLNIDEEALFREILTLISTWQAEPSVLRDKRNYNWLPQRKSQINWNFWKRYRYYLEYIRGRPEAKTNRTDRDTDDILGNCGDPAKSGSWDRRGMVVGEVQSGKTENYTALISKATDAGYKLIIVLTGMTDDLRSQTQQRLDKEFLGFESNISAANGIGSKIGVGLLTEFGQLIVQPLTYSSREGDFRVNRSANIQLGGDPILLVVKKNTSILKRIITWVKGQGRKHPETGQEIVEDVPLLLIDDEADYASVNTKDEDESPTAINGAIRQILASFQKSSYVGYTATPFANIFISPDDLKGDSDFGEDLFPRDFIYNISSPSNYIGPVQIFGLNEDLDGSGTTKNPLPVVKGFSNHEDRENERIFPPKHKQNLQVDELPQSLIQAIKFFILTCAARRCRGQKKVHNSMLIHVTRFNAVQKQVMDKVQDELFSMIRMIEYKTGGPAKLFITELEAIWKNEYEKITSDIINMDLDRQITPLRWNDVEAELFAAAKKIRVVLINSELKDALDYDNHPDGFSVIAVGGNKLSRGLTLEGLSVSYYLRLAKNYDTLLQMGRWFGYRPGYIDLCRLFTTKELIGWYEYITVANEELRRELSFMELSNLTPKQYGLKVRTHPDGLGITSANKMQYAKKMRVSFSDYLSQTPIFHKDEKIQRKNFELTDHWIGNLINPQVEYTEKKKIKRIKWLEVGSENIKALLGLLTVNPLWRQADPELLNKYISKLNDAGELTSWTVVLLSTTQSDTNQHKIAGHEIGMVYRSDITEDCDDIYTLGNANISDKMDESLDLSAEEIEFALKLTQDAWTKKYPDKCKLPKVPSRQFLRQQRPPTRGLLLLYPLDYKKLKKRFSSTPIIGFAISFPKSGLKNFGGIEYHYNTQSWQDRLGVD